MSAEIMQSGKTEIVCEWEKCKETCEDIEQLDRHIFEHLDAYLKSSKKIKKFVCPWGDCKLTLLCKLEYQRHVYYHGYYSGLLARGKQQCNENPELRHCRLKPMEHFVMPELTTNFVCNWSDCTKSFLSVVEYIDHAAKHALLDFQAEKPHGKVAQDFACKWAYCKKRINFAYHLNEHMYMHTKRKDLACYHCGQLFRTKRTLVDHILRQQESVSHKFQCAQCLKCFSMEKFLKMHVIGHIHSTKCTICNMTCGTNSLLTMHIRYRHLDDKPFKCGKCDACWVRKSDLVKHTRMVHDKVLYVCHHSKCRYAVKSATLLRRHLQEKHENVGDLYVCHCCDESFKIGELLSSHLIKCHNFQLPPGHKRFVYRKDEKGFYHLETARIEISEVTSD